LPSEPGADRSARGRAGSCCGVAVGAALHLQLARLRPDIASVLVRGMLAMKGGRSYAIYAIWTAYQFVRIDLIHCRQLQMGLLGLLGDGILLLLNRRLLRWNTKLQGR
jgi:hypothetical protein